MSKLQSIFLIGKRETPTVRSGLRCGTVSSHVLRAVCHHGTYLTWRLPKAHMGRYAHLRTYRQLYHPARTPIDGRLCWRSGRTRPSFPWSHSPEILTSLFRRRQLRRALRSQLKPVVRPGLLRRTTRTGPRWWNSLITMTEEWLRHFPKKFPVTVPWQ